MSDLKRADPSEPVQWLDATCCLCLWFRKAEGVDFCLFQKFYWKNEFLNTGHKFIHRALVLIKIVKTHTHWQTYVHVHTVSTHNRQKTVLMEKTASTCISEIKCYTFCKLFHNGLFWFQWLSVVHTQAAAIVPHLMLMNACCMDTSCIIPLFYVSVDFSMAKKLMQSIFYTITHDFCIQLFKIYLINSSPCCTTEI